MFHGACVRDLLKVLNDVHSNPEIQGEVQGDYLSATCLLRSYEILNGKVFSFVVIEVVDKSQVTRDSSSICSAPIPSHLTHISIPKCEGLLNQEPGTI